MVGGLSFPTRHLFSPHSPWASGLGGRARELPLLLPDVQNLQEGGSIRWPGKESLDRGHTEADEWEPRTPSVLSDPIPWTHTSYPIWHLRDAAENQRWGQPAQGNHSQASGLGTHGPTLPVLTAAPATACLPQPPQG